MAHIVELRLTFQDIRPLFISIIETWLDNSISDSEIDLLGYSVHCLDQNNRRGGGVALYILDGVKHYEKGYRGRFQSHLDTNAT